MQQQPPSVAKASLGKSNTCQQAGQFIFCSPGPFPDEGQGSADKVLADSQGHLGQAARQRRDPSLTHNKTAENILGVCLQPHKDFMQCI